MNGKSSFREEKLLPRRIKFESSQPSEPTDTNPYKQLLNWNHRRNITKGLRNLGNTCFLNATLQCLLHTPPVYNVKHSCKNFFCVLCSLKELHSAQPGIPHRFLTNLPKVTRQFRLGRQEDAHELLRVLVNRMGPKDFYESVFGGTLKSKVKCKKCGYESDTFEPFLDLSLNVTGSEITKCLENFFREEHLGGSNKYKCERCKTIVAASKQYFIKEPPLVLTLHLKRFNNFGQKDNRPIRYPEKLNLSKFLIFEESTEYELYSVAVHVGHSCRSGHYFAFVKGPNDLWYDINDCSVSQASTSKVLNHNSAYILFYKKVEKFQATKTQTPKELSEPTKPSETTKLSESAEEGYASNTSSTAPSSPLLLQAKVPRKRLGKCLDKLQLKSKKMKHTHSELEPRPIWTRNPSTSIGYVKDSYDQNLDKGKTKKKKKQKKFVPTQWWDKVEMLNT